MYKIYTSKYCKMLLRLRWSHKCRPIQCLWIRRLNIFSMAIFLNLFIDSTSSLSKYHQVNSRRQPQAFVAHRNIERQAESVKINIVRILGKQSKVHSNQANTDSRKSIFKMVEKLYVLFTSCFPTSNLKVVAVSKGEA